MSLLTELRTRATNPRIARAGRTLRQALTHLRTAFAPLTGLGRAAVIGLVVSLPLGWIAGWVEFRILALVLAIALAVAVVWTLRPARYAAEVRLENRRSRVGESVLGGLIVTNPSTHTAPGGRVDLPVGRAEGRFAIPRLGAQASHEEVFHVRTRRRAIIGIGPAVTVRADPLGLMRRSRECAPRTELFVHPEVTRLEATSLGFLRDLEGVPTQNLSSSDVSFHALRDYVPGDDRRSIHWRTTARTGKLTVRQFEETMRSHLLIVLSTRPEDYADADDFEMAVSCAGSLALAADREDREVDVHTPAGLISAPTGLGALDHLCGVELAPAPTDFRRLSADAIAAVPSASVVALIGGSATTANDLRAAHLMLPPQLSTFALRCGTGLPAARRAIGTLTVLDLSTLGELPGGLRTLS